ncbi:unnamed protein product [Schistosoma curassoni]|uniref:Cadherin domain-containing protein n=1 Tax=Schistosoma curassoni TaxID=6186 RepID=A0A3P8I4T3_9TREM|nr:unnamed protein product [Schistosoma curassoni]
MFSKVLAIDIDAGENGTILYFIHSGNDNNYFQLDSYNGILSIHKQIPYNAIGEYILKLEARDCGKPYRFTITELIIEIDQSPSKAYLTTNIYQLHNSDRIMQYGASDNTLNLYIIIAIIAAACVISTILLFLVFIFLQRTKRNRHDRTDFSENSIRKYHDINMKELHTNYSITNQSQNQNMNKFSDYGVHPFPNCSQQLPSYEDGNNNLELINHPNGSLFLLPVETDYNYGQNSFNKIPGTYWSTNSNIINDNNVVNMETNENRINLTVSSYNMNNLYNDYTNYHNGDKIDITGYQDVCQTILNGQCSIPFSIPEACNELTDISKHIMKTLTSEGKHGIHWTAQNQLDDLEFADDPALPSHTNEQMQIKTASVAAVSASLGLNIHKGKTKVLKYNTKNIKPITLDEKTLENGESFTYLGSIIDEQGGSNANVKTRIDKARTASLQLKNIWNSKQLSTNIKVTIFNTNVKTVLLYGAETWGTNTTTIKKPHILMSTMDNWPKLSTTDFTSNIIISTDCDSGNGDSVEIQPNLSTKVYFVGRT